MSKKKVLFLCTHNSARSQMAEAWLRHLGDEFFEVASAGSLETEVRPEALTVMKEAGIDISEHSSKTLDRFLYEPFDLVITVCDQARDSCPVFPKAVENLHWSIEDPSAVQGAEADRVAAFRVARNDLEERIRERILPLGETEPEADHTTKLERMYLSAPANEYFEPRIEINPGEAQITIGVHQKFFHAAGSVHGSVYFKALDDACFFAASSLVEDVFLLTSQFNIHLVRPVSQGILIATGRVSHSAKSSFLASGELHDEYGDLLARGEGIFVRSRKPLTAELGYA